MDYSKENRANDEQVLPTLEDQITLLLYCGHLPKTKSAAIPFGR